MSEEKVGIDLLAAVHHPVRRRIVEYLVFEGPSQVGAMARAFGEQVGSISHHLRMLERAGLVERAPELATDGRTSWWRYTDVSVAWSADDFADSPADLHRARAAEKLNLEHQVRKYVEWKNREADLGEEWRRAAFSSDSLARCSAPELRDLLDRLRATFQAWREEVVARVDSGDDEPREPVFWFTHGFPTRP
ncbi:ArsR family transcriptional regulator [Nocardioides mangrovicus]|uniref:ArsR family transcriptional regulator n=1 Tax=Nocardioides mangrovicus TaxID=2478913 RepID=A0A3L8P789_9ACTN|nr:helix-turn-helix domain-containing protein [Nocardioides mangrovicus]RLV50994.1 ArsR family transcriptional regulator [Nocardioides mangrovicus]